MFRAECDKNFCLFSFSLNNEDVCKDLLCILYLLEFFSVFQLMALFAHSTCAMSVLTIVSVSWHAHMRS